MKRRAKQNITRQREDPAPRRLSHSWRQQAVNAVTGGKESFSMLGTSGRQAGEENKEKKTEVALVMVKIKCCRFPEGQSGQKAMRPRRSLSEGRQWAVCPKSSQFPKWLQWAMRGSKSHGRELNGE